MKKGKNPGFEVVSDGESQLKLLNVPKKSTTNKELQEVKILLETSKTAPPIHVLKTDIDDFYKKQSTDGYKLNVKIDGVERAIQRQTNSILSVMKNEVPGVSDSASMSVSEVESIMKKFIKDTDKSKSQTDFNAIEGNHALKQRLRTLFLDPFDKKYRGAWEISSGIQLGGLPGVGKTMSIDALVGELKNRGLTVLRADVKPSNLLTKYVGDSEKLVETVFHTMKYMKREDGKWTEESQNPKDFAGQVRIIFIDETESLAPSRTDNLGSQYSGTLTDEILMGTTDVTRENVGAHVIVVLSSNFLWRVDTGLVRRVQNIAYVEFPSAIVRRELFKKEIEKWANRVKGDPEKHELRQQTMNVIFDYFGFKRDGSKKKISAKDAFAEDNSKKTEPHKKRLNEFDENTALLSFSDVVSLSREFVRFPFYMELDDDKINIQSEKMNDSLAKRLYANIKRTVRIDEIAEMLWFQKYRRVPHSKDIKYQKWLSDLEKAHSDWDREQIIAKIKILDIYAQLAELYTRLSESVKENDPKKTNDIIHEIRDIFEEYPILTRGKKIELSGKTKKNKNKIPIIAGGYDVDPELVVYLDSSEQERLKRYIGEINAALVKLGKLNEDKLSNEIEYEKMWEVLKVIGAMGVAFLAVSVVTPLALEAVSSFWKNWVAVKFENFSFANLSAAIWYLVEMVTPETSVVPQSFNQTFDPLTQTPSNATQPPPGFSSDYALLNELTPNTTKPWGLSPAPNELKFGPPPTYSTSIYTPSNPGQ